MYVSSYVLSFFHSLNKIYYNLNGILNSKIQKTETIENENRSDVLY